MNFYYRIPVETFLNMYLLNIYFHMSTNINKKKYFTLPWGE